MNGYVKNKPRVKYEGMVSFRQMVQGQTAHKFSSFDEGDVWRHQGHSKLRDSLDSRVN